MTRRTRRSAQRQTQRLRSDMDTSVLLSHQIGAQRARQAWYRTPPPAVTPEAYRAAKTNHFVATYSGAKQAALEAAAYQQVVHGIAVTERVSLARVELWVDDYRARRPELSRLEAAKALDAELTATAHTRWFEREMHRPAGSLNHRTTHIAGKPYHWRQDYTGQLKLAAGESPW